MWGTYLDRVRETAPLIHNITNYVTANDVANLLLACGARPVMADDPREAGEIAAHAAALHLNLGTFSPSRYEAMLAAGEVAGALGRPIVLDPVGVGGSALRREAAHTLLERVPVTAVRGNFSELRALEEGRNTAGGVDAVPEDGADPEGIVPRLKAMARSLGVVLAATGPTDLVTDGERCFVVCGGCPEMSMVTGTGCQLSALTAAFLGASPGEPLEAVAAAVWVMGLAGETGLTRLAPWEGNAALRGRMIDAVYHMTGADLEKGARIEKLG